MNPDAELSIHDLHLKLTMPSGTIYALRGVNFSLYPGERLAIVGESGSGKSLTVHSILDLLPRGASITQGQIFYGGKDLLQCSAKERRVLRGQEIAMVFQNAQSGLNPTMRIAKQITEGLGLSRGVAKQKAQELLSAVGIPNAAHWASRYPHELSGGMRQRVMIAIALARDPKLLIADEPTSSLDADTKGQFIALLQQLQEQRGMSLILITHDLALAQDFADRILVMYAGQIVESASAQDLFESPKHPYSRALMQSSPRWALKKRCPLAPIPGSPPDLHMAPQACAFVPRCPSAMKICALKPPPSQGACLCWLCHPLANQENTACHS